MRQYGTLGLVWFDIAQHQGTCHQDWHIEDNPAAEAAFRRCAPVSVTAGASVTTQVSQKVAVSVVYVAAMFMTIMDATIVNVALPTIGRSFGVPATSVASVSIYFLVSLAVFIPASGWLGDRFGGKRVLLSAIVVFTVASALCGTAESLTQLDIYDADAASTMVRRRGHRAEPGRHTGAVPAASGLPEPQPS